jgi:hypothetical protein
MDDDDNKLLGMVVGVAALFMFGYYSIMEYINKENYGLLSEPRAIVQTENWLESKGYDVKKTQKSDPNISNSGIEKKVGDLVVTGPNAKRMVIDIKTDEGGIPGYTIRTFSEKPSDYDAVYTIHNPSKHVLSEILKEEF